MTRRDTHYDAMLKHLGATYYQTLQGRATPADVVRALDSLEREAIARSGGQQEADEPRHGHRSGRWRVRDVMSRQPIVVDKRATGAEIARIVSRHQINAVPVVTGGGRVAGVVSEADLLRTQHHAGTGFLGRLTGRRAGGSRAGSYTAAQLMTAPAITIHPDAPLGAAARRMTDSNLTMLPVIAADGKLLGVVSRRDLLRVFLRSDTDIAAEVRQVLGNILLLDPDAVTVAAHDGLVTLTGEVGREDLVAIAERLAGEVDGVLAVVNKLAVSPVAAGRHGN